jgi:hypothetical protein
MSAKTSLPLIALLIAAMASTGHTITYETMSDSDGMTSPTSPTMAITVPLRNAERRNPNDVTVHPRELRERDALSDPTTDRASMSGAAIEAAELARPDDSIRDHLKTAYAIFDADRPAPAADEIFQATVLLRRQLAFDGKTIEATHAETALGGEPGEKQSNAGSEHAEILSGAPESFGEVLSTGAAEESTGKPADAADKPVSMDNERQLLAAQTRRLRDAVRKLEEFNLLVADEKVNSRDAFKDPYSRLYRELTSYHFQLACRGLRSRPVANRDRQWMQPAGAGLIVLAETIDDMGSAIPPGHGWASDIGRTDRTNDPAYHALQAAEYFKSWVELLDRDIDPATMEVMTRLKETTLEVSADADELPEVLDEFGGKLDAHGINVPEEVKSALKEEMPAEGQPPSKQDSAGDMPQ